MSVAMNRLGALILALALCLSLALPVRAETEYPPFQGIVADMAGVLSDRTIEDLKALSGRLEEETGGHLYVLTRHFLGGAQASQYAQRVFEVWGLNDQDALLLLVVGEDTYALALGAWAKQALPQETQTSLLANHLRTAYLARQYDAAVADFALNAARSLAKAAGETLNVAGLFGQAAAPATPQPQSIHEIWQGMFAQDDYTEDPWNWEYEWEYEDTHINWRGILIWALVIYFLFFRRRRRR